MELKNKNVFITGTNRGLGRHFVDGFLTAGAAKVYAAARNPLDWDSDRVRPIRLDVTCPDQVSEAAAKCIDVDLLINNAGVASFSPFVSCSQAEDARYEMEVNYFGVLSMCRAFAGILGKRGGGAIVNILSVSSLVVPGHLGSYAASKSAALALTRGLRIELRSQSTSVLGVYAGYIATDMTADLDAPKEDARTVVERVIQGLKDGREEIFADERSQVVCPEFIDLSRRWQDQLQKQWDSANSQRSERAT